MSGEDSVQLERFAAALEASGDYKVLRRFQPRALFSEPGEEELRTALFVDVETTGVDAATDRIIEFAGVLFTYGATTGRIHAVGERYAALEDPGRPISAEIQQLTGITDAMVAGQRIDDDRVHALAMSAQLVIAHNASFDRPFTSRRFPVFAERPWACSIKDVHWERLGLSSAKLEFLLMRHAGAFFHGHRAEDDCLAAIEVLAKPTPEGVIPFQRLLESSRLPSYRVRAVKSHYDQKDLLKARGYRWDAGAVGREKAWWKEVRGADADAEFQWLREHIYGGREGWELQKFTALNRYTEG